MAIQFMPLTHRARFYQIHFAKLFDAVIDYADKIVFCKVFVLVLPSFLTRNMTLIQKFKLNN